MATQIRTIQDLMKATYIDGRFIGAAHKMGINKADAPMLSSTDGVFTAIAGAKIFSQLNNESNIWSLFSKRPYDEAAERIVTARGFAAGTGGRADGAAVPDTTKATIVKIKQMPKLIFHGFSAGIMHTALVNKGYNDAVGSNASMNAHYGGEHVKCMNEMLGKNAETEAGAAGANRAAADMLNFESLDRIISSDSEEDVIGGTYTSWCDPYGTEVDRDSGTDYDSVVLHNSGTDRYITTKLVEQLMADTKSAGANRAGQFFLTGHDTASDLNELYSPQGVYTTVKVKLGMNGVEVAGDNEVGISVAAINGIPLFVSDDCPKDTKSKLFLIDSSDPNGEGKPRMSIDVLQPTVFVTAGEMKIFEIAKFANMAGFLTMAEIKCRNFVVQGKLTNLK